MQALIENGAHFNTSAEFGWTALMQASANGHTEVVRLLLAKGANVNAGDATTALKGIKKDAIPTAKARMKLSIEKNPMFGVVRDETGVVRGLWFPDNRSARDPKRLQGVAAMLVANGEKIENEDRMAPLTVSGNANIPIACEPVEPDSYVVMLGLIEVPVIVLGHLMPAQRKALVLADNKLALNAGWDEDLLRLELGDLRSLGFDLDLTGFNPIELADEAPHTIRSRSLFRTAFLGDRVAEQLIWNTPSGKLSPVTA